MEYYTAFSVSVQKYGVGVRVVEQLQDVGMIILMCLCADCELTQSLWEICFIC